MSPTTSRYEEHADWYLSYTRDWGSSAAEFLPADLTGQSVLDLACGWGQFSRTLADRGAAVTAVDLSTSFIEEATTINQERRQDIDYRCGDATNTDWWDGRRFDRVVCNMALMDVDDLDAALQTVATVIAPGGTFTFTLLHPCFPGDPDNPGTLSSWPPERGYAAEGWWSTRESGVRGHVGAIHRMLSTYLNAVLRAGFTFDTFEEPATELPQLLFVHCRKN